MNYTNYEVLIVDNASNDDSPRIVRQNYPLVKVIENHENLGFATANNVGAQNAKGEYLFLLNNDTKVDPDVLTELTRVISDTSIGICACKLMSYDGKKHYHTGIGCDIFGYPLVSEQIFYAEGAALIIRQSLFKLLGGFDQKYFMFHEDIDLAWRALMMDYQVVPVPKAVVYHAHGASAGGAMENGQYVSTFFRRYLSERNNIRTILKNYSWATLIFILPMYYFINLCEIIFFTLTFKYKIVFCYIKAHLWNMIFFRDTLKERKRSQTMRKVRDRDIMRRMYRGSAKFEMFKKIGLPQFK